MAEFIQGTTPTFSVTLHNAVQYSDLGTVIFRFANEKVTVDKTPTTSGSVGTVTLTQEETLSFHVGECKFQVMAILGDEASEVVPKSQIITIAVKKSLWDKAVHNG